MPLNHFSSDLPEALWWSQPQYQHHHNMDPSIKSTSAAATSTSTSTSFWGSSQLHNHPAIASHSPMSSNFNFDLNNEDEEEIMDEPQERENHIRHTVKEEEEKETPKEPLFEKPLTPSDVGKLNRLVIPKQHAEKYFTLNGNDSGENGSLLTFEDELGKQWRFRYSYWNSSQSYVLTKGWSRFVKEKRLDAGDIVLFERHRLDGDRLFIGWRRRRAAAPVQDSRAGVYQAAALRVAGGGGRTEVYFSSGHNNPYPGAAAQQPHHNHPCHGHGPGYPYQPDCLHAEGGAGAGGGGGVFQQNQTPGSSANSNSKRQVRLFGVNLECQHQPYDPESDQPPTPPEEGSGHGQPQQAYYQFHHQHYPKVHHAYFNHPNHMNIDFSGDTNHYQSRYRKG